MLRLNSLAAVVLIGLLSGAALGQTPSTQPTARRGPQAQPSATQPVLQARTQNRHDQFLALAKKGDIDLLFLGDSITDNMRTNNPLHGGIDVWNKYFAPLKAANFGIGADRTQNVLWRIQNGELDGFKAKCIVLLLGTNNVSAGRAIRNTNAEVLDGMKLVIGEIRARQPQAKLILMAIFPRDRTADGPYRQPIKEINAQLAKYDDGKNIFFIDIGDKFLAADGSIPMDVFPDQPALHPNAKGYEIWANGIIGKVKEVMGVQ